MSALDLEDDSDAADRRVVRLKEDFALETEEVLCERIGADDTFCSVGGARHTPAATFKTSGLSIYFSIKRSLFQFMCRKRSELVLSCLYVSFLLPQSPNIAHIDTKDATDMLDLPAHEAFDVLLR